MNSMVGWASHKACIATLVPLAKPKLASGTITSTSGNSRRIIATLSSREPLSTTATAVATLLRRNDAKQVRNNSQVLYDTMATPSGTVDDLGCSCIRPPTKYTLNMHKMRFKVYLLHTDYNPQNVDNVDNFVKNNTRQCI